MLRLLVLGAFALMLSPAYAADDGIPGIGPAGPVTKVHGDFEFTEGPAFDAQGSLFFTDVSKSRIYKLDTSGVLSTFAADSNNADGMMFNAKDELVVCEMQGQVVSYTPDGKRRVIAATYAGTRFNAPNDLVIDKTGGIYFTDARYLAPTPWPQGVEAVYYIAPDGSVSRIIDDVAAPNGITLSPDEKTLYLIPSIKTEVMAYPVTAPGKLGKGTVFGTLKAPDGRDDAGGDGRAVDEKGNLYVATKLGVQVFSPKGKWLGIITLPEQSTNLTFGGPDGKTLVVAARTSIYSVPMKVPGHRFAAK